jgi:hypothetical protein
MQPPGAAAGAGGAGGGTGSSSSSSSSSTKVPRSRQLQYFWEVRCQAAGDAVASAWL